MPMGVYASFRADSHSADEGLRGRNVLIKSCSCYIIPLESWRICPLAFLHVAMSLYNIIEEKYDFKSLCLNE